MSELEPWRANLIVTGAGTPKPLLANAITALREAPAWQGVLAYDQFALQTVVSDAPPWHMDLQWATRAWSSHDDLLAAEWLQRSGIAVNTATAAQAVEAVARERSFHPVIDYLSDLQHDGVARSETWLSTCLGAEQSRYNESVGRAMRRLPESMIPVARSIRFRFSKAYRVPGNQLRFRRCLILGSATSSPTLGPKMR
jgi:predicted P-loop ATPase